jgi:ABC-type phosphate transport system auxiliary subunit
VDRVTPAGALLGVDPALARAARQRIQLERRLADTSELLALARKDRLDRVSQPIREACWAQATRKHRRTGLGLSLGLIVAGSVGGTAALLSGMPGLGGLVALGSLVGAFHTLPRLYAGAIKKWLLPGEMDRLVVPRLQAEKARLQEALQRLDEEERTLVRARAEEALAARPQDGPCVEVEEAFVVIGGVRMPVRR